MTRADEIERIMRAHGVLRDQAEFIYGIEHGEHNGDVVDLSEDEARRRQARRSRDLDPK